MSRDIKSEKANKMSMVQNIKLTYLLFTVRRYS